MKIEYITVFYISEPEEVKASNGPIQRWRLVIEHSNTDGQRVLNWVYTYSPTLAESIGTKKVQFYQDTSMRTCIRIPRKD